MTTLHGDKLMFDVRSTAETSPNSSPKRAGTDERRRLRGDHVFFASDGQADTIKGRARLKSC
jgi:hypothetical protein